MSYKTKSNPVHLYGVPGAEEMYTTPEAAFEAQIEPYGPTGHYLIEEWSIRHSSDLLPSVRTIIEQTIEMADEVDEGWYNECERVGALPEVVEAFTQARTLLAAGIGYWMAHELIDTHEITWPTPDTPHMDGKPMHHMAVTSTGSPK